MDKEGLKGYGLYWMLMECLAYAPRLTASMEVLRVLKKQHRRSADLLQRVLKNYGLFVVKNGTFYSPELKKSVKSYQMLTPSQNDQKKDKSKKTETRQTQMPQNPEKKAVSDTHLNRKKVKHIQHT
ncbi:MAG: DUF4373 domain-containing protein [Bacteroides sp.]|nr:DUF4373 domain-containing protein [Bacteroides sp.]